MTYSTPAATIRTVAGDLKLVIISTKFLLILQPALVQQIITLP